MPSPPRGGFYYVNAAGAEIWHGSKLENSENPWYNIFRKREVMSQGFSEKARVATDQTDGSNLVYCPTITYTYK